MLDAPPVMHVQTHADYVSNVEELCRLMARKDFCYLSAEQVTTLLHQQKENALLDWCAFRDSWSQLSLDGYMADGGHYRKRRHATLSALPSSRQFQLEPYQPHYQATSFNTLNGGIARHYEPIDDSVMRGNTMRSILAFGCKLFGRLSPYSSWHIEVHQFRIEVNGTEVAKPTPEGIHRDGVSFVMMLMLQRTNVVNGVTAIYDHEKSLRAEFVLADPLDMAIINDERVFHAVTPIDRSDPDRPGHRDVLVVTFRHKT
jgi:hypothetical protein